MAVQVLRLAGPAILASLLQTLVFLADRLMLARYSQDALASMQLQGPVMWSVFSVFLGLLVGTIALVARSVGARDFGRAQVVARASLRLAVLIGIGVGGLGVLSVDLIVDLIGPDTTRINALSATYMTVAFLGIPAMFLATAAAMILQASGDTRTPFLVGLVSNTTNIGLNWVLIFGVEWLSLPALGVAGAAIATVIAFSVEAALLLWVLGRQTHPVHVLALWRRSSATQREREAVARRDILRISIPSLFDRMAVHVGFLAFVGVVNSLGAVVMAANQALVTLESICFLSADGFGVAAAAVVGQRLGQGDIAGARRGGWVAAGLAVAALSLCGLVIWVSGPWALRIFVPRGIDGSAMIATALSALPLLALAQPFMAFGVVLAQGLRGAGDTRSPLLSAVLGSLVVRVALAWTLAVQAELGIVGIWLASTGDWLLRTAILTVVFARGRWSLLRV